jgi:hypothetical protein
VKNLSIALHLIQDDLYHYMDYDTWLDNWGGALSVFQAYCGLGSQCWPTGDLNAGQRVDSTILWLEQRYQQKGLPRWSEGAIETVETCGELVEWLGDIGAGICVGVAGVGAAWPHSSGSSTLGPMLPRRKARKCTTAKISCRNR